MPRYRLTVEYDGTPFRGWQRQVREPTVQEVLETACAAATGTRAILTAAGRTDAGVHAAGQVVHLDLAAEWVPERLGGALNAHVRPWPVVVTEARRVAPSFHARFDAVRRHYLYRILNRRAPPALERDRCWHLPVPLEAEHMHEAAQALVGRHDFTSYRSSECQAPSPVKTLHRAQVSCEGPWILCRFTARSFLHHQVRAMVGTLKLVGEGRAGLGHAGAVLAARDRKAAGQTAPAAGLVLLAVDYA